ncbi:A24 family peptidase [Gottschalkiaceae bacterium SANA]|nr:A24 family peptidase [Gottschalkiaceae bacterium SANA]
MTILTGVLGLIIGSFLNVVAYRVPREESLLFPPSHCPRCDHRLGSLDLIPVFSFLMMKGSCRYCEEKISWQYPLVEAITGFGFALIWMFMQPTSGIEFALVVLNWMLFSFLIVIFIVDYKEMIIPDEFNIGIAILAIVKMGLTQSYRTELLGFAVCGLSILLIVVLTNGMGMGDTKMFAVLGLWFGLKNGLFVLLFSIVIGAILSVILLATKVKTRKDKIPFGPFISIAAIFSIFFADPIMSWYFQWFNL